MKLGRLIGIVSILLQKDKVTAPYLAEKFEVSRRTINRDIEDICKAGIPIMTTQGRNGGISIMEGYKIDKTLLTTSEIEAIITGLKSLDSITKTKKYENIMDKLKPNKESNMALSNNIIIDLSMWRNTYFIEKIELLKEAIKESKVIYFTYCYEKGNDEREIEPYLLIFQWGNWYIYGYCLKRKDYRLFKISRIIKLKKLSKKFVKRDIDFNVYNNRTYQYQIYVKAIFHEDMKWQLIDEYGMEKFNVLDDGRLTLEIGFSNKEKALNWALSYGDKIELVEPKELREDIQNLLNKISKKYC